MTYQTPSPSATSTSRRRNARSARRASGTDGPARATRAPAPIRNRHESSVSQSTPRGVDRLGEQRAGAENAQALTTGEADADEPPTVHRPSVPGLHPPEAPGGSVGDSDVHFRRGRTHERAVTARVPSIIEEKLERAQRGASPSPSRPARSLAECLRAIQRTGTGNSVFVTAHDDRLLGVLTERDVFGRLVGEDIAGVDLASRSRRS